MKNSGILGFIFCLLTGSVFALPTITGATGLITMPTAEIMQYKDYNFAVDYQFNLDNSNKSVHYYKMNIGALENAEFGFVGGTNPNEGVFLNLKWNLSSSIGRFPLRMAVGLENLTSTKQSDFYLVASKKLRADVGLHGGFKTIFSSSMDVSFMCGLDYAYNEFVVFVADLTSKQALTTTQGSSYVLNGGAIFKLFNQENFDNVFAKVVIENVLHHSGQNSYLNMGLTYTHNL